MLNATINKIVIAGGGTSGWMLAAALSKLQGKDRYDITLIESEAIGSIGVGEATIPNIQLYTGFLGIDEGDFLQKTQGTYKLGIKFIDWTRKGESYFHPFGGIGAPLNGIDFIHYWLRHREEDGCQDFGLFNVETLAARENKCSRMEGNPRPDLPSINYAYHFDAALVAKYLRTYAETRGVTRVEGEIIAVEQNPTTGYVESLVLKSGEKIAGHLFLDCTGFSSLLIGKTLGSEFIDWSHWLPCDSAVAMPCESASGPLKPYTCSTAKEYGWQWRIPLQSRVGNGYVYSSQYISDELATQSLVTSIEGKPLGDPRIIKFKSGYRKKIWDKNVIACGLSGGFLEPLESTAIYLVQSTITKLLAHLPKNNFDPYVINTFNQKIHAEYQNIRDFLIAHYKLTERNDTEFWRHCQDMELPESLKERLGLFKASANCNVQHAELFKEHSWFAVLIGQGLIPDNYHPLADMLSKGEQNSFLSRIHSGVSERVSLLDDHRDYLNKYLA